MSSSIIKVNAPSPRTLQVSTPEMVFDAGMDHEEWPALNSSKIDNTSNTPTVNEDYATPGVNTSTDSDWELLPPGEVPSLCTSTTMASTMKKISVPTPTSRPKRSQTIGTEQEALARTTELRSRPVLKHCQSSPDLRHSFYDLENVAENSDSAADDRSDEDSGSGIMIENDSSNDNHDDDNDDEASSSIILVSGPPSVVTAATSPSVWSAATPAASKLSFAAALATPSSTTTVGGDALSKSQQQQQQHRHHRRHNKLKKSKIVVVAPTMKRNSKSMGDLKSLGRILEQEEEEEEERQRRARFGRHKFPQHFYPRALGEDQEYNDDGLMDVGDVGGGGDYRGAMSHEGEVLGETDAQEFYQRKETGKLGRENGLKSRPDEAKRLDIILAKKELQREQQKKGQQKPKKAAEKKKPSGGGGGKGRTRW